MANACEGCFWSDEEIYHRACCDTQRCRIHDDQGGSDPESATDTWWDCPHCNERRCDKEACLKETAADSCSYYDCCACEARVRLRSLGVLATACCAKIENVSGEWICDTCNKRYCDDWDCLVKVARYGVPGTTRCCAKDAYYHEEYPSWRDHDSD
ncbi:hypothetical protein QKT49_gp083 [Acanthamoeba castellanii medusavirus]|uniref:Uncharacterized protein n=1 Tax=Acanthamoeba castellanii medusavirus J1 TaxID=3114988 RepID=A0A3T1CWL9_9VIRU|nr:hypothetical protein QKT49_gp083 [Acanthamoeba castellanii medusavirus]BBI30223.1 hypothetical protein [Acanthamoeba castellanii medusavirus J1]